MEQQSIAVTLVFLAELRDGGLCACNRANSARTAIREILLDTKSGLPDYWKVNSESLKPGSANK